MFCVFCRKYLCDLYWNGIIWFFTPKNMCIDTKIILILCVLTEISIKTRFSVMAALICIFSTKYLCDLYRNGLIWFFTPKNMCIDTKSILIPCVVTEILTKTRFSVMAALICILCGLPKGDRVASSRFLKSTSRRYRNSKKNFVRTVLHAHRSLPAD